MNKKQLGQYYTVINPFDDNLFRDWVSSIPNFKNKTILEPFCGSNNIKRIIREMGYDNSFVSFDIDPECQKYDSDIQIRDTISDFPAGYSIAITNPPYLAKNSAKRMGLDFPETKYEDLYQISLDVMLENCDYVSAIIPESFITQGIFHDRLFGVSSITSQIFDDTDCPVCVAYFTPEVSLNFTIYSGGKYIGDYLSIKSREFTSSIDYPMKFNDKRGQIGVIAVDNTKEESIRFVLPTEIEDDEIKVSSRARTRVWIDGDFDFDEIIEVGNELITQYRRDTHDVFMTSFKGLRVDGKYRRRLDFKTIRTILNMALEKITS